MLTLAYESEMPKNKASNLPPLSVVGSLEWRCSELTSHFWFNWPSQLPSQTNPQPFSSTIINTATEGHDCLFSLKTMKYFEQ